MRGGWGRGSTGAEEELAAACFLRGTRRGALGGALVLVLAVGIVVAVGVMAGLRERLGCSSMHCVSFTA